VDSEKHLMIVQAHKVLVKWETAIVSEMTFDEAISHCAALMEQGEVYETRFYKFGRHADAIYIPQWPD